MTHEAGEDTECGQQVGPPDDIGYRLGEQGVQSPQRCQRPRQCRLVQNEQAQEIDKQDVPQMQNQVDPVVASQMLAVSEDDVVDEVRKGRERAI